jgi:hypothetical protein
MLVGEEDVLRDRHPLCGGVNAVLVEQLDDVRTHDVS